MEGKSLAWSSFHLNEQIISFSLQTYRSRKTLEWMPTEIFQAMTQCLLEAQDDVWARGWIFFQVMLISSRELSKPADSLVQVFLFWQVSINRCEQVSGGTKCHCFIAGTVRSWCTRDDNCSVVQPAHQSALSPGTYISFNLWAGTMPSEQMVVRETSQTTMYSRCIKV